MSLILIFTLASLLGILGAVRAIGLPDQLIQALFGVALFCIAAFIRRRHSWR